MESLLGDASLPLITLMLVLGGFGLPFPEDPVLIAAGAFAGNGVIPLWLTIPCCIAGVIGGDLILFSGGRRLGPAVKRSRPFRALGAKRIEKLDGLLVRRGGWMIAFSRPMMGIRVATFVLAGMHHMKLRTFLLADCLAFAITGPIWFGLGYVFATQLEKIDRFQRIEHAVMIGVAVVVVAYVVYRMLRKRERA